MRGMSSLIRLPPSLMDRLPNTRFIASSRLSLSPSGCAPARLGGVSVPLAAATAITPSLPSIVRRVMVRDSRTAIFMAILSSWTLLYTSRAAQGVRGGIRRERPGEPERAAEVAWPRCRAREREPLAVNLEGLIGVHDDVAVAIVGSRLGDRDLLVPAVLAAQGIGLDRERQVLVDARLRPPDPRRVGVVARERPDALPLAHPPLPALDLLEVDERGGPALASRVPVKSPSPQMVRARDHAGADRLRRPDPVDEVADRRRDLEEIARDDGEPGGVFGMEPQRIGVRDLVEPLRVARARVDERRESEGRQEHHLALRAVDPRPVT